MAKSQFTTVFRQIRKAIGLAGTDELPDGQLLERFVARQDDLAFEQLIQRYGPMVLGACRRILVDPNDADDAFQATFLVLVRRAATLDQRAPLGSWLYGVALRVALKARAAARRRERQRQTTTMSSDDPTADLAWNEVRTVLDEELQQLPEKYRAPLVLCYLAGKTNQEAAQEIGCPLGSMGWRLDRARTLLRDRLVRRGIAVPAVALAGLLAEQTQAAVPASLAAGTLQSAVLLAAGEALPAAQAHVFKLAEGVVRNMVVKKFIRTFGVAFLLIGLVGVAVGAAGLQLAAGPKDGKSELAPVIRSAKSGSWSSAATWEGGKVPGAGARVLIRQGHRVVYDGKTERPVRAINVSGTLAFAPDKDTRLDVGLIKIQAGDEYSEEGFDCEAHVTAPDSRQAGPALEVGTPNRPIDANHKALIRLAYHRRHGQAIVPGHRLLRRPDGFPRRADEPHLGQARRHREEGRQHRHPGRGRHRLEGRRSDHPHRHRQARPTGRAANTEERTIQAIDGTKLTLDRPLENEHLGEGLYRGEVANLSRNVVVESADPKGERGHTMYHRYSAGSISYAEFRHLGKEGVLGRYSLHYHLVGDTMRGSSVIGASIWDSGNRWLTIHGTNYLVVRDSVGYGSVGHGFFMEDGTEVYNVLDRNLAVGARRGKPLPKQVLPLRPQQRRRLLVGQQPQHLHPQRRRRERRVRLPLRGHRSKSFPLVFPIQQPDGTKKDIDIRTLPFVRFDDNEVHSDSGHYGVNLGEGVNRVGPDTRHPFIVRNLLIWNSHYGFRPQVPSLLVENMRLHGTVYGVYHPNYDNHVYRNVTINGDGSEPFNRGHDDISVQYGAVDGGRPDLRERPRLAGTASR